MRAGGSPFHRRAIPLVAFLLVAAGCATRVDRARDSSAAGPLPPGSGAPAGLTSATDAPEGAVAEPGGVAGAPAPATGPALAGGAAPSGSANASSQRPGAPGSGATATGSGTGATAPAPSKGGNAGGPTPPGVQPGQPVTPGPALPDGGPKSPVVVASVGTYSGPVGVVLSAILYGAQMWVKHINAAGGLNGHPVQMVVYDDAGDPARHRAQVQAAVEQKKALALFANADVFTGQSSVQYINEKKIPLIGSDTGAAWAYSSPMYFMQAPGGNYLVYTMLAMAAKLQVPLGKEKLGVMACAEVVACDNANRIFSAHAKRLGFDLVYSGRASIAQPDFTAECLAARNAGVESFLLIMDTNSLTRVTTSCTRQSFQPTYATVAGNILDVLAKDPKLDGLIGNSNVAPWFQTGTPATDEFQAAVKKYGQKSAEMGVGVITGWTAGKLLERAGANLPEPPTTAALLKALWSIKNETLGGLTPEPLTFTENQPAAGKSCWYAVRVAKGAWTSPDGFTPHCDDVNPN